MNPDGTPYSWYDGDEAHGIAADIFIETANRLGLNYEIVPVADKEEYENALASGDIDIWMDAVSNYEDEQGVLYKLTDPYLSTTVSMLQRSDATGRAKKIAILQDNIVTRQVAESKWPEAELVEESSLDDCMQAVLNGKVDGALLKTYTAQQVARKDSLNRLRTSIVPGLMWSCRWASMRRTATCSTACGTRP